MNRQSSNPERFKIRTGGLYGPAYSVRLKNGELLYRIYTDGDDYQESKVSPAEKDWADFRQVLDAIDVWHWKDEYPGTGEAGFNQWFVEIEWGDRKIKSFGDSNYPVADGNSENEADISPTFEKLLEAVRKLIGGREFR